MTLTLPAQFEGFVRDKVKSGSYSSEEEVVGAALGLLEKQDGEYERECARISAAIDAGWEQARAGKLIPGEQVWAELEEWKQQWRARRAAP